MKYVIIGNGVAGINSANEIRNRDADAKITIISKESDHFFSRTALMYVFCGQMSQQDIEPFERDHYDRMKFTRVRDEVVKIDPNNKQVHVAKSEPIPYDRLIIAAGSVGRMVGFPGEDLDGVGNFVTWQNLEWLQEKAKTTIRACIIGGGLIGIEAAEVLLMAGIKVSFIIREDWFWPIALNKAEGDLVTEHMEHHGCEVHLKTDLDEIVGRDGKVVGIKTKQGDNIDCELIIFAIGVRPQTDWLKESGIEMDNGGAIRVNEFLQTNIEDIYAAGDCTSVVWFNGARRPEQLWYTSRDQGRIAGVNAAGDERIYKRGTFYNSAKFFDLEYSTAGYVNFNFDSEADWYQHEPGTNYTQRITYLPDNTVVGFNFIGRRWDHRPLVKWVDEKRKLNWVIEHLHEANFDEEFMPKFKVLTNRERAQR